MWIVAKYNVKEFNLVKKKFKEVLGYSPNFYIPKIRYQKTANSRDAALFEEVKKDEDKIVDQPQ